MSTTTPLPLASKSALVTGAACSIGAEIELTLARRAARGAAEITKVGQGRGLSIGPRERVRIRKHRDGPRSKAEFRR